MAADTDIWNRMEIFSNENMLRDNSTAVLIFSSLYINTMASFCSELGWKGIGAIVVLFTSFSNFMLPCIQRRCSDFFA